MKNFFYRVAETDTVFSVSKKFNLSPTTLIKQNSLKREIECGDLLYIERDDAVLYKVAPFDTPKSIAEKFNTTEEKILSDNGVPYLFYGLVIKI